MAHNAVACSLLSVDVILPTPLWMTCLFHKAVPDHEGLSSFGYSFYESGLHNKPWNSFSVVIFNVPLYSHL